MDFQEDWKLYPKEFKDKKIGQLQCLYLNGAPFSAQIRRIPLQKKRLPVSGGEFLTHLAKIYKNDQLM